MKSAAWIFRTDVQQNKWFFILLAGTTLLLGAFLGFSYKSFKEIQAYISIDQWDADIAVLPKGVSLTDLKSEILSGQTTSFLPEALFRTTRDLAKGQFKLGAILSLKKSDQPVVFQQGDPIGINWLKDQTHIRPAEEQSVYQTPEWGTHVMTAFFASGPHEVMKNFKDLIDRKSIGQAIWIEQENIKAQAWYDKFWKSMTMITSVIVVLSSVTFLLLFRWIKDRLGNLFQMLDQIGFPFQLKARILVSIFILFVVVPFLLGSGLILFL